MPHCLNVFFASCADIDIQRLSYVAFERYGLADERVKLFGEAFAESLRGILHDRNSGGFTVSVEGVTEVEVNYIKLSTAISHLVGNPIFDAMAGNYFAKFAVKHTDNSDSYFRSAYSDLKLHSDGA